MKFPISWLNDYVDVKDISARDYAHALTMSGSKVEGVENAGDEINNVVVGKLVDVKKHENSDHLNICQVDIGDEVTQIVTGAQNIKTGDYVPVAKDNSYLPGGVHITKGKLRGELSNGMLCSYAELGLSKEDVPYAADDGILILPEPVAPGTDIKDVFGLDEDVVEFEITSNRPDCFSVIGLARETAVTFARPYTIKTPVVKGCGGDVNDYAKVTVQSDDCMRYAARVIKNVKIGESPKWMKDRLRLSGIRSINNIVDITNYVLLEYGQPMHAFNLEDLEDGEIVVRKAKSGEKIVTLDGEPHELDESMLAICDKHRPVCVAGVMGGENSEVRDTSKEILFECATFNGPSVRITAKKLGLRTESSSRYEKGLDVNNVIPALNRACELVELLGAGEVVDGTIDVMNCEVKPTVIKLRPDKINAFLGTDISRGEMEKILTSLEFKIDGDDIIVPSFRPDVLREADVAEEIARIYGYNEIVSTALRGETTRVIKPVNQVVEDIIHSTLVSQGLYETLTFSFIGPKLFSMINSNDEKLQKAVVIKNPLGEDTSIMRTTLLPSVMSTLALNYSRRNESAKIYEFANVYIPVDGQKLPDEHKNITLGMYGGYDFYDMKGVIEHLFDVLKIRDVEYVAKSDNTTFHPGRCAQIVKDGKVIGIFGEAHPDVCKNFGMDTRVYICEIDFNTLLEFYTDEVKYKPLPKYPAVTRDIAMLIDDSVNVYEIEKIIKKCSGNILEGYNLFDVYKGAQIPEGKKSVAYSVTFRADDRTLTDEEINGVFDKIVKTLEDNLSAQLR